MRKVLAGQRGVLNPNDVVFCSWSTLDLFFKDTLWFEVNRCELVISSMKLTVCCMDNVSDGLLSCMVMFQRELSRRFDFTMMGCL